MKQIKKHWKAHPILRNLELIIGVFAVAFVLGAIATFGKTVVDWVMSLGHITWITIFVTALVCGVIFGAYDAISAKKKGEGDYEE